MILKSVALCRCSVEVAQEKVVVFTLVCLHMRRLNASASALGHQITTQSN